MSLLVPRTGFATGDFPILPSPISVLNPLARYLVGYWAALPGSVGGSRLIDWTSPGPNGNHGTLTNMDPATDWIPNGDSRLGWALDYNGTGGNVIMGDITELNAIAQQSISVWVKPTGAQGTLDQIVGKFSPAANDGLTLILSNTEGTDDILWGGWGGANFLQTTGNILPLNEWTHIVGVFNGLATGNAARLKLYANGVEAAVAFTGTIPALTPDTAFNMTVGATHDGDRPFRGQIGDIAICSRALSLPEVQFHFYHPRALLQLRSRTPAGVTGAPPAGTVNPFVMGSTNLFAGKLAV